MKNYILIGFGGLLGAILRYLIKWMPIYHYHEKVPLNTLFINITGSFMLALILTIALEIWRFDAGIRQAITTGFLGAFTTFSTLCKETTGLIYQGDYFSAISYISTSIMIGLAAAYFGIVLAREVVSKFIKKDNVSLDEPGLETEGRTE